jgi:hypothetical protein
MSLTIFLFRDFIQCILPTLIALCLFLPFWPEQDISLEGVVFGGALLSYLTYAVISEWVPAILGWRWMPIISSKIKAQDLRQEWMEDNWDFGRLWFNLDKEERDYLLLLQSYKDFYQITGFYLLIYFIVNLILYLLPAIPYDLGEKICQAQLWDRLRAVQTPIWGIESVPTLIICPISLLLVFYSLRSSLTYNEMLFSPRGIQDCLAQKYQKKERIFARSIWGRVFEVPNKDGDKAKSLPHVKVMLYSDNTAEAIGETESDPQGYFQFKGAYTRCAQSFCFLKINDTVKILQLKSEGPYVEIYTSPTSASNQG